MEQTTGSPLTQTIRSSSTITVKSKRAFFYLRKAASLITLVLLIFSILRGQINVSDDVLKLLDQDVAAAIKVFSAATRTTTETTHRGGGGGDTTETPKTT